MVKNFGLKMRSNVVVSCLEDVIFIMISWIAWIHDLVGACDSDEVTVQDYFLVWFISSWFGEDGFYDALGNLVP